MTVNDDTEPTFAPHKSNTMSMESDDDQQQLATSILGPTSMETSSSPTKNDDINDMDIEKENDHNFNNDESLPPPTQGKIMDDDTTMDDSTDSTMTDDSSSETTTPPPSPTKVLENTSTKKMKHTMEGEGNTTLPSSSDSNNDKDEDLVIEKKMDNVKSTVDALVEKRLGEDLDSALDSLNEVRTHIHVSVGIILVVIEVRNCYDTVIFIVQCSMWMMLYLFLLKF